MSQPIVHRFRASEVRIYPADQYLETRFPDGAVAPATRECELNNRAYAEHLGYPDCWTAVVTHELAHTLISERLGHLHSPTLYAVAAGYRAGTAPYEERLYEEALVLAVERYANTGEVLPILRHPDLRPHYGRWAREIRALAARLLSPTDEAA